ncbi:TetR family transcriptional regulator [Pseudooceanicola sp. 216_PA32_1]|uniref:TetR family transcriptional regulator n=1 Tax=Pseudooceanicola pacificus TaxID=2676438 RepID=A0A844W5L4_9RHOB|nr:TetR family transcriptional regulator [Pseudooceanicola pacificus]MWB78014.1 TetR family transcriptional regulator [Pseudooceanicola pacificus]
MDVYQPSGARRKKRARNDEEPALSRERIVATALQLIDEKGLDVFSLRAVAKALGVYPTALYWHVPNRNALVVEVIGHVLSEVVPPRDLPWEPWLRSFITSYRTVIRRHPNVAPLIGVQLLSNASVDLTMVEGVLKKLSEAGYSGEPLVSAYNSVIGTMVGFVTQEFAMVLDNDVEDWMQRMSGIVARIDPDDHPVLTAHKDLMVNRSFILRWENGATAPLDGGFDFYVEVLIAGLKALAPAGDTQAAGVPQ